MDQLVKPAFRGKLHFYAIFLAAIAGASLILQTTGHSEIVGACVYTGSLVTMFSVSSVYHIPTWSPAKRLWLRRLDHCAIFLLIAGTATPVFLSCLTGNSQMLALAIVWSGAGIGFLQSLFWVKAPKLLVAIFCVVLGWTILPFCKEIGPKIGGEGLVLFFVGGVLYSLGAIAYGLKRPILNPQVFGYHELFHLLIVLAAGFHYLAIYHLLTFPIT